MSLRSSPAATKSSALLASGVEGLDEILGGGLAARRLYLIEGVPGSGKTTLAMQFLLAGVRSGERVLYVTLSETAEEINAVADSHGWSLDGIAIRELVPMQEQLGTDDQYTMFHPSEVELSTTTKTILADVERVKPTRVVFDSLSELRLIAGNPLRYRRQILALKQFFAGRQCTVLLLDDLTSADHDLQVQSIAHGALRLEQLNPEFGSDRRRVRVVKFRGMSFRSGYHDFIIQRGGVRVFPRLAPRTHTGSPSASRIPSDVTELDELMGGGIERGSSTLIVGAAGVGKSTIAAQFVTAAATRGQRSALFVFDETPGMLMSRCDGVGIDLRRQIDAGRVTIQQIDPAELSPGEFAHAIRTAVEVDHVSVVLIDSLNGYLNAMPEERFLIVQLHELLSYLAESGVASLLVSAHQGLVGGQMTSPIDASYLADAVVLLRYFESRGEIRQAISVVKKRGGAHERTIREFRLEHDGIKVGRPLREFRGVLTGMPVHEDPSPRPKDGPA